MYFFRIFVLDKTNSICFQASFKAKLCYLGSIKTQLEQLRSNLLEEL